MLVSPFLSEISSILHGFGSKEEPIPKKFINHWAQLRPEWKQVHGTEIQCVDSVNQNCGEVDALFTTTPGVPIGIITADCVPILMAREEGKGKGPAVVAIHAGWRGTQSHIVKKVWNFLLKKGECPEDWTAAIGPAIGPCCYQVSEELALEFSKEFSNFKKIAVPKHRALDLPAIQQEELKKMGVKKIDLLQFCTFCSKKKEFYSYRKESDNPLSVGRQLSIIQINNKS